MPMTKQESTANESAVMASCPRCGADITSQLESGKWWFEAKCPKCGYTPSKNDLADVFAPVPRLKGMFEWFDLWWGIFIDTKKHYNYFFPIPMFGIRFHYRDYVELGLSTVVFVACMLLEVAVIWRVLT